MVGSSRMPATLAVALAFSALTVLAAPATAGTVLDNCTGTCGLWEVRDAKRAEGALCTYEFGSYDLDSISVRPPKMRGPWAYKTGVGWKYRIMRSTNSGGSWSTYYTSTWQSATANQAFPAYAGNGFSRRSWNAPDPNPTGRFLVRVYMRWQNSGGSVVGNAAVEYDHYKTFWNVFFNRTAESCKADW